MKPHSDNVHIYGNKGFRTTAYPNLDSEEPRKPKKRSEHKRQIARMKREHREYRKRVGWNNWDGLSFKQFVATHWAKVNGQWQKIE